MKPADLIAQLCIRSYEPPLSELRENGAFRDLSNPVVVLLLLFDFNTEVTMSGINGFLTNSTRRYADETVAALMTVGCPDQARKLREILDIASGDASDAALDKAEAMSDEIDFGAVSKATEEYADNNRIVVEAALASLK